LVIDFVLIYRLVDASSSAYVIIARYQYFMYFMYFINVQHNRRNACKPLKCESEIGVSVANGGLGLPLIYQGLVFPQIILPTTFFASFVFPQTIAYIQANEDPRKTNERKRYCVSADVLRLLVWSISKGGYKSTRKKSEHCQWTISFLKGMLYPAFAIASWTAVVAALL